MASLVQAHNLQTMQFSVTAPDGSKMARVTTGLVQLGFGVVSQPGQSNRGSQSYKLLLDPPFEPGQFRKATAVVSLSGVAMSSNGANTNISVSIDDVEASLDDESGKVELRFEVTASGSSGAATIQSVSFQVMSLATA